MSKYSNKILDLYNDADETLNNVSEISDSLSKIFSGYLNIFDSIRLGTQNQKYFSFKQLNSYKNLYVQIEKYNNNNSDIFKKIKEDYEKSAKDIYSFKKNINQTALQDPRITEILKQAIVKMNEKKVKLERLVRTLEQNMNALKRVTKYENDASAKIAVPINEDGYTIFCLLNLHHYTMKI